MPAIYTTIDSFAIALRMDRFTFLLAAMFTIVVLAACANGELKLAGEPSKGMRENAAASDGSHVLIGLGEDEARAAARQMGRPFRVVKRDGKALFVTMDHLPGRLNATVLQGVVTGIDVEAGGAFKLSPK